MPAPLGICDRHPSFEILAPAKQGSSRHSQVSKAHSSPRFACGFENSVRVCFITKLCRQQTEVIHSHENGNIRNIGQSEDRDRKFKRLKLGVGQAVIVQLCRIMNDGADSGVELTKDVRTGKCAFCLWGSRFPRLWNSDYDLLGCGIV
jgi:hypothetical protein